MIAQSKTCRFGIVAGLVLGLGSARAGAAGPLSTDLQKAKAAVLEAVRKAPENGKVVDRTPAEFCTVLVLLPYASETYFQDLKGPSRAAMDRALRGKKDFWSENLKALESASKRLGEEMDGLAKKGGTNEALAAALEKAKLDRMVNAVKDILEDIQKDKSYASQSPTVKTGGEKPSDFLSRKRRMFNRLSSLRGAFGN